MLIGITGVIGSGKSYIKNMIASLGYLTFDCDKIVRLAYQDVDILKKLEESFDCLTNNKFDKQKLKEKLNDDNLKILNSIIHPFVIDYLLNLKQTYTKELVFVEIPLLFEEHLEYTCDYTIAISVSKQLNDRYLKNRDEKNYEMMKLLASHQLSNKEKAEKADFVIHHNYNEDETLQQINIIIDTLEKKV